MSNQYTDPQSNIERARTLLSPYIDGEVSAEEQQFVETQLATSDDLRQELESLRQTVSMVAQLPQLTAPRPFTLSEADVGSSPQTNQSTVFGLSNWLTGWIAAAASLLVMIAVGGTLFFNSQSDFTQSVAYAPSESVPLPEEAAAEPAIEPAFDEEVVVEEEESAANELRATKVMGENEAIADEALAETTEEEVVEEALTETVEEELISEDDTVEAASSDLLADGEAFEMEAMSAAEPAQEGHVDTTAAASVAESSIPPMASSQQQTARQAMEAQPGIGGAIEPRLSMAAQPEAADENDFLDQAEEAAAPDDIADTMRSTTAASEAEEADAIDDPFEEGAFVETQLETEIQETDSVETQTIEQPFVDLPSTPTTVIVASSEEDTATASDDNQGKVPLWIVGLALLLLFVGYVWLARSRKG